MSPKIIRLMPGFILFSLTTTLLMGCASATPTSHPTAIPTILFADTFTPQPTATITLTPTTSTTPTPSTTATASITPTPLPSRTLDLTEMAFETYHAPTEQTEKTLVPLTQQALATLNVAFPSDCRYQYPSVSPDGNWLADDCNGEFHIYNRDGQQKIVVTDKQLAQSDVDAYMALPYHWSKDSQYLYFASRFCCMDSDSYSSEGPLYRLDLQSSKWVKITGEGLFSNSYSFSPTGRRLLHIPGGGNPVRFHIVDLQTNAEQWLELQNFQQAGAAEWSPDGRRFAVTAKNGSIITENAQYALFVVSLDDLSITQLIPLSDHSVYASNWSDDDVLTVDSCTRDRYYICKQILYDVKAK